MIFFVKTKFHCQTLTENGASSQTLSPGLQPILQTDSTTAYYSPFAGLLLIEPRTQRRVPSHRATPGVGGHRYARLSQCPDSAFSGGGLAHTHRPIVSLAPSHCH